LGELKNVFFKISLFQAINYFPIYSKEARELCLKKLGRKQKDPQTIHVMGKLSNLMMGGVLVAKYSDPGSLVVKFHINDTLISNTLIDLWVSINLMMPETVQALGLRGLWETPTVLQLADRSTIKPEGILEDVVISI
jgi:hypothetical protein